MEKNFLSLSFQSSPVNMKEELNDDSNHSALPDMSSGMQWSFSSKVSAVPQFLSFKAPQENRTRTGIHDSMGSMTLSCPDAFDTNQKTFSSSIPKSYIKDNKGGCRIPMTVYNPQETKICQAAATNQPIRAIPVSLCAPSHVAATIHNVVSPAMQSQSFGGHPVRSSTPANSSVVGTTDLMNSSKTSGSPAQLTIFYGGSVNVYEDIPPEKAQAIMLLAGNGNLACQNKQVFVASPRPAMTEGFERNWSFPGLPTTPISVTMLSKEATHNAANMLRALGSSSNLQLPHTPSVISTVAVPQARKASLARFLEKRKERVISASPYAFADKSSEVTCLSVNSSQRSSPLSSVN